MRIFKSDYPKIIKLCNKRHKIRENDYGVCWCVRCGRLCSSAENKLTKEDQIVVI